MHSTWGVRLGEANEAELMEVRMDVYLCRLSIDTKGGGFIGKLSYSIDFVRA